MSNADTILQFISDEIDLPDGVVLNADTALFSDRLLDSISLVMLIEFIEEAFGIKVKSMDIAYQNFDTVNFMLAYIARRKVGDV